MDRQLFAQENLESTCQALAVASGPSVASMAPMAAAERNLADCDHRLDQYRKALDSGADPAVVADWIADVQMKRTQAEQELTKAQSSGRLTEKQIRSIVDGLKSIATVLADADPKVKAQLYDELGVTVTYDPVKEVVSVESLPAAWATVSVGGGI